MKHFAFLVVFFYLISVETKAQYSQYVPDSSFGQNGQLITTVPGQVVRSLVLPDTTILLGGYGGANGKTRFVVLRLNGDGSYCNLWGNAGVVIDSFPNTDQDQINDMLYLPNERVLLMGRADSFSNFNIGLSKHVMNGNLDSSFGVNGRVILPHLNNFSTSSMALQSDGKIVLAGGYGGHIMVCRLHTNGIIDSSFGTNGISTVTVGTSASDGGAAIRVLADDRIIVGGHSYHPAQSWAAVVRFLPNGKVDSSFGTNGHVETNISGYGDFIDNITIQADGKILATGYNVMQNSPIKIMIIRYDSTGNLDATFAANGVKQKNINNYDDKSYNAIIQPDGKIVLGGYTVNFTTNTFTDFMLYRIDSSGNDDYSFAAGGVVSGNHYFNQSNYNDKGQTMCAFTNGKLVVAGNSYLSGVGTMTAIMWRPSIVSPTTEINDVLAAQHHIGLYPIPAEGILHIHFSESTTATQLVIEDISGHALIEQPIPAHTTQEAIDISLLSSGVYVLKWIHQDGTIDHVKWLK